MVRTTAARFTELPLNLDNLTELCLALEQSWKKVYSRGTTKSIPLFQPEHGFCQNNGSERGQTQDWYLNDRCCSLECVSIVLYYQNKGDKSLPLLAFRRDIINAFFPEYSKEGNLSPSHIGIRNIPSDVCYDDTKHF